VFIESPDENGKVLTFDDIVQLMFDALFESDPPLKVDLAAARTYLSNTRPLVYLNGIAFTSTDLDNLSSLFPSTPILIESEQSVTDDDYDALPLGPFERKDSLALLSDHSGITLDDVSHPVLDEIANILGDVPGALVIIANALKGNRLKLANVPAGLSAIDPGTKLPVKAALNRAYRLVISTLSADERAMLIETASAPGISVDRKWLERGTGGVEVSRKLESLQLLYANSPRLRLNSGLREIIMQGQDDAASKEQLLQYLKEQIKSRWNDFDFVRDELGNLLGLFDWAMSQRRWGDVVILGRSLDPFLTLGGLWDAWHHILIGVYQAAAALGDTVTESWALHQIGTSEIGSGNLPAAHQSLEHALKLRQKLGDKIGAAYSQHNLDLLTPPAPMLIKPKHAGGGSWPWIIGGGLVLLAVASWFTGTVFGIFPPLFPTPTFTATETLTITPSSTPTFTPSPTPTSTSTPTFTPSPTDTSTSTSTPVYLTFQGEVIQDSSCYYGPGSMYLYKYGLKAGSNLEVVGINIGTNGPWLYVQNMFALARIANPCWVDAQNMKVGGSFAELAPVYPDKAPLPKSPDYPAPMGVLAKRDGNQVFISWDFTTPVPPGMRESTDSPIWLVELWTCQKGQIVFTPIGAYNSTVIVTDEPGCAQPSHGRVFLSDVDGYDGPTEIQWSK
jgi:hypothetical protein